MATNEPGQGAKRPFGTSDAPQSSLFGALAVAEQRRLASNEQARCLKRPFAINDAPPPTAGQASTRRDADAPGKENKRPCRLWTDTLPVMNSAPSVVSKLEPPPPGKEATGQPELSDDEEEGEVSEGEDSGSESGQETIVGGSAGAIGSFFDSPLMGSSTSFMNHPPMAHSTPVNPAMLKQPLQPSGPVGAAVNASSALNAMAMAFAYQAQHQGWPIPTPPGVHLPAGPHQSQQPMQFGLSQGQQLAQTGQKSTSLMQPWPPGLFPPLQAGITQPLQVKTELSEKNDSTTSSGIQSGSGSYTGGQEHQHSSTSSSSGAGSLSGGQMSLLGSLYSLYCGTGQQPPEMTQQGQHHKANQGSSDAALKQASETQPKPQDAYNNYETICAVPGRLTLLSNVKKYRVTAAEVQRRISPPECLNASIMGGILRKAKNKDGGRLLRDNFSQHGITLPSGRRKSVAVTCFTSLVEEESIQMSRDFDELCKGQYPTRQAASYLYRGVQSPYDAQDARAELFYAQRFLKRLLEFQRADRSPVGDQRPGGVVLDTELQKGLTNFSMLTHGFGGFAVQTIVETLINCAVECGKSLDTRFPTTGTSDNQ